MPCGSEMRGAVKTLATRAEAGDMSFASRMLAAQALILDVIFGELTRRTALNMGTHFGAAERYARLALKAQSNSRATLEALAKLHQPREQTVRHLHVNEGGQAIVADQVHNYAGRAGSDAGCTAARTPAHLEETATRGSTARDLPRRGR